MVLQPTALQPLDLSNVTECRCDLSEGIDKRRQARPRIMWKPIEREKGEASGAPVAATRLKLSLSLSAGERFFFCKPGPHYRLVDGGNLDLSIVHFHYDSSSTIHRNEGAVRLCRLNDTPNDRHQSGGR